MTVIFIRKLLSAVFLYGLFTAHACAGLPDAKYKWTLKKNDTTLAEGTYREHFAEKLPSSVFFVDSPESENFRQFNLKPLYSFSLRYDYYFQSSQVDMTVSTSRRYVQDVSGAVEGAVASQFLRQEGQRLNRVEYAIEESNLSAGKPEVDNDKHGISEPWQRAWGKKLYNYIVPYRLNSYPLAPRPKFTDSTESYIYDEMHSLVSERNIRCVRYYSDYSRACPAPVRLLPETVVLRLSLGEADIQQWLLGHINTLESQRRSSGYTSVRGYNREQTGGETTLSNTPASSSTLTWEDRIIVPGFYEQETRAELTLEAVEYNHAGLEFGTFYRLHIISLQQPRNNFYISLVIRPWYRASNYLIVSRADIYERDLHYQFVHEDFPDPVAPVSIAPQNLYLPWEGLDDRIQEYLDMLPFAFDIHHPSQE